MSLDATEGRALQLEAATHEGGSADGATWPSFFESSAVLPREQNWGMAESTPTRIVTLAGTVRFVVFSAILLSSLYGITIATGIHPRVPLTALAIVRVTTWRGLAAWLPTKCQGTQRSAQPRSPPVSRAVAGAC
jgi:hypothetical protein